jgi:integrase
MTRVTAAAFVHYYVTVLRNRENNLPTIFSGIKFYHRLLGFTWPEAEELFLSVCVRKGLQNANPTPRNGKFPLTIARIQAVRGSFNLESFADLRFWCLLLLGHGACLRIGELMNLKFQDVIFVPAADLQGHNNTVRSFKVTLTIHRSKMNKRGPPETVEVMPNGPVSAPYPLRLYWLRLKKCKNGVINPNEPLFPIARTALVHNLKRLFPNESVHSGYSFRAGCTTDMWNAGLPPEFIKSHGRWAGDAFRCYAIIDKNHVATQVALAHQAVMKL